LQALGGIRHLLFEIHRRLAVVTGKAQDKGTRKGKPKV
jgi:hypothetical protein